MAKDRAAPFSRKHRRYWIPVTGGMIVIGIINVAIGMCSYTPPPPEPREIDLKLPPAHDAAVDAPGTLGVGKLPAAVMRAFAVKYPRTIPTGAKVTGELYELNFPPNAGHAHATFKSDGTFVSED